MSYMILYSITKIDIIYINTITRCYAKITTTLDIESDCLCFLKQFHSH